MSSGVIQNLDINLRGKTGQLKKPLNEASASITKLAGSVNSAGSLISGKLLGSVAAAAGAVYAATASWHAMSEQIEQVSALVDTSNRLNISVAALTGFTHAAKLSGMSAEEMTDSLEKMGVNVSKASVGMGKAQKSLKELGLDAKQLKQLSPDEQFNKIADALQGVENDSDKLRHAVAIFGDSKILNAMEGGSEALRKYQKDAEFLGLTLTGKTASGVESAGDAMDRVGLSLDGTARTLVGAFAPAIEWLSNGLADALATAREWLLGSSQDVETFAMTLGAHLDNSGTYWELYKSIVGMALVGIYEDAKHYLTEVIPTVFTSFAQGVMATLEAMGKNMGELFNAIFESIKTGSLEPFSDMISFSITDGFEKAFQEIGSVITRNLTPAEETMAEDIANIQTILDKGIADALEKRKNAEAKKKFDRVNPITGTANKTDELAAVGKGTKEAADIISKIQNKNEDALELAERQANTLDSIDETLKGMESDEEDMADL